MKARTNRKLINVKVDIRHGPAESAQKAAWHKFYQKLIAAVKADGF